MTTTPAAPTTTAKFEVGKTYATRSNCDWDTIFSYKVVKRTAKFITITNSFGDVKRVGVKDGHDGEWALPEGTFSMAPVISAATPNV